MPFLVVYYLTIHLSNLPYNNIFSIFLQCSPVDSKGMSPDDLEKPFGLPVPNLTQASLRPSSNVKLLSLFFLHLLF